MRNFEEDQIKMATKKDLYMYVQSPEVLCRLNVTKLCKGGADLELVCDFRNCTSTSGGSTMGMGCMLWIPNCIWLGVRML